MGRLCEGAPLFCPVPLRCPLPVMHHTFMTILRSHSHVSYSHVLVIGLSLLASMVVSSSVVGAQALGTQVAMKQGSEIPKRVSAIEIVGARVTRHA